MRRATVSRIGSGSLRPTFSTPRARRAAGLADEAADLVVTNPPFFEPGAVRASPDAGKARAHVFGGETGGAPLVGWIRACLALLRPGGRFALIHRPDALAAILAAAEKRLGALALLPVHPRAGAPAHRLLVSGVKGSKAPLRIAPAAGPARGGRAADAGSGGHPSRRTADRRGGMSAARNREGAPESAGPSAYVPSMSDAFLRHVRTTLDEIEAAGL